MDATREAEALLSKADEEQVRMMEERVILTDYYDNVIGHGSKKDTHIWPTIEAGMLHRAFSVFLFTPDGKLILQQRAESKITFPLIWANTCCSHPLHVASELTEEDALGVRTAARRKLEQELGIPPEDVPLDSFTWITRVHYVGSSAAGAVDGVPVWGEHEIDWILMCKPAKLPRMSINPNEVQATRAFSQAELKEWMATRASHGNQVSPWFGVMEASLLYKWWDAVLAGNLAPVMQRDVIHRQHDLECIATGKPIGSIPMPKAFQTCLADTQARGGRPKVVAATGSASHSNSSASTSAATRPAAAATTTTTTTKPNAAAVVPGASAATPKQGAYGKVPIHKESLFSQLCHVDEVMTALAYKFGLTSATKIAPLPADAPAEVVFCEEMLCRVSRSFAMVIQQLPPHLRLSVCVFYLVLRGLDTVEDDMQAFAGRNEEKLKHLRAFHTYLYVPGWNMDGVGEGDELLLLQKFDQVNKVFQGLPTGDASVIADICKRMGEGMASFSGRDLREGTRDTADYNLYCHFVAGLVGEGLSRLWVSHGDEGALVAQDLKVADDMGLFLQKTNIIRDYLEDLVDGRAFWPRDVWSQYAPRLADLRSYINGEGIAAEEAADKHDLAMACLNHMVADALTLMPSCLTYMQRLRNADVFKFCSVPQLMAIATLQKVVNNPDVFTGVVKIRKGQALRLVTQGNTMQSVYLTFLTHARGVLSSIPAHHKTARAIATAAVAEVERICLANLPSGSGAWATSAACSPTAILLVSGLTAFLLRHLYQRSKEAGWGDGAMTHLPRITDSWDVLMLSALVACVAYLFAMAGVPLAMRAAAPSPPPSPRHSLSAPFAAAAAASASAGATKAAAPGPDADVDSEETAPVSASAQKARRRVKV